nr:PLP-dependent aminotransferase family protein [Chloroflexia bacterium]
WLQPQEPPRQLGRDAAFDRDMLADTPGVIEFRSGRSAIEPLPPGVWRRIWGDVGREAPPGDYGPALGDPDLRAAIADHLGRSRGVVCDPSSIVVTTGAVQGIDLVARATLTAGDTVGFEEPGAISARNILEARGAGILRIPVDEDGLRVDDLPRGPDAPRLVYVTPAHQYPLGVRLSADRRTALLKWAQAQDSLVLEDDYDSEFRFGAPPLPALASLDTGGHVAYLGTFSKVLTPALRVGYLVAPPALLDRLERLKRMTDYHTPWPVQRALAGFLLGGHLERHIRRMRRHYASKRLALLDALSGLDGYAHAFGLEAGLHFCIELAPGLDASAVSRALRARGVIVTPLADCYDGPVTRQGLILGYGGLTPDEIVRGGRILVETIREHAESIWMRSGARR